MGGCAESYASRPAPMTRTINMYQWQVGPPYPLRHSKTRYTIGITGSPDSFTSHNRHWVQIGDADHSILHVYLNVDAALLAYSTGFVEVNQHK